MSRKFGIQMWILFLFMQTLKDTTATNSDDSYLQSAFACGEDNDRLTQSNSQTMEGKFETQPNEFPWLVAIEIVISGQSSLCSGSLISEEIIVTAAHCLNRADEIIVTLGAHNISEHSKEPHQQQFKISQSEIHHLWDPKTRVNDIALIQLPHPVAFSEFIRPICWEREDQLENGYVGHNITTAGWSQSPGAYQNDDESDKISVVLRKTWSTIISNIECGRFTDAINITQNMLCSVANYEAGPCPGDSGGPVMLQLMDGSWKLIGVISIGFGKFDHDIYCERSDPVVHTDIHSFIPWIRETLSNRNYELFKSVESINKEHSQSTEIIPTIVQSLVLLTVVMLILLCS